MLLIKQSKGKGRGVFAKKSYQKGELIESCHIITFPAKKDICDELMNYCYHYDDDTYALALGYGSLYNHSEQPNAEFEVLKKKINIYAMKNIKINEEICINYGYTREDFI